MNTKTNLLTTEELSILCDLLENRAVIIENSKITYGTKQQRLTQLNDLASKLQQLTYPDESYVNRTK